jgi:murein DD-endopeptidase MepM/ murein hydrolase activator NlpD
MLNKKTYFKLISGIVFATTIMYAANTANQKLQETNKISSLNQNQQVNTLQIQTITLTSVLEKSIETENENGPTVIIYTVKASDTAESIASTYEVKLSTILESNQLTSGSALTEGQNLVFPSIDGIAYKIQGGETLWDLANLYKLTVDEILQVNKLENPDKLKLNQYIIIPNVEKALKLPVQSSSQGSTDTKKSKGSVTLGRGVWPASGRISSKFGPRWGRKHEGIDIAASTGTNVYAFMEGKVTFSGTQGGYGKLVIIDHGNGLKSYYGHNSKLIAKVGQTVTKGTHIAEVGSTGNSTGPHLHFEIRKNGTPVNPYTYLK